MNRDCRINVSVKQYEKPRMSIPLSKSPYRDVPQATGHPTSGPHPSSGAENKSHLNAKARLPGRLCIHERLRSRLTWGRHRRLCPTNPSTSPRACQSVPAPLSFPHCRHLRAALSSSRRCSKMAVMSSRHQRGQDSKDDYR